MQDKIGQRNAINAAVGIGGGAWKDYEDNSGNLLMTIKITGDDQNELQEINDAFYYGLIHSQDLVIQNLLLVELFTLERLIFGFLKIQAQ